MNIGIIGASAGIGLATVYRGLELGHRITTLSRRKIEMSNNDNLDTINGNALDIEMLKKIIFNNDVILVTLGTGMNIQATTLYSDFANLLIQLNEVERIDIPIIIVTGFGSGESRPFLKQIMKPIFRFILNKIYENKAEMEQIICKSSLNWEIVRPGLLNNKPLSEKYRYENKLYKGINIGSISRNDVADYLIKEAVNQTNMKMYVSLSNK